MRFLPTNFARAKKAEESQSTDITSISVSKSEEAFEDLMKAVSRPRACLLSVAALPRRLGLPRPGLACWAVQAGRDCRLWGRKGPHRETT